MELELLHLVLRVLRNLGLLSKLISQLSRESLVLGQRIFVLVELVDEERALILEFEHFLRDLLALIEN